MAKPLWIGHHIDLDNPAIHDRETKYPEQASTRSNDHANRSIDKCGLGEPGATRELNRLLRPVLCAVHLPRGTWNSSAFVDADHQVWIEHGYKAFKIATRQVSGEWAKSADAKKWLAEAGQKAS